MWLSDAHRVQWCPKISMMSIAQQKLWGCRTVLASLEFTVVMPDRSLPHYSRSTSRTNQKHEAYLMACSRRGRLRHWLLPIIILLLAVVSLIRLLLLGLRANSSIVVLVALWVLSGLSSRSCLKRVRLGVSLLILLHFPDKLIFNYTLRS